MVTEDEQTKFFNTIFAPLRAKKISKIKVKKAADLANEFFEGIVFSYPYFYIIYSV